MTEERIEIDRISTAVQNAHLKVIEKGGTSAAPYLADNLAEAIGTIPEATEPTLQSKTVTPETSAQTVKPDSGYDGLSQVTVNAMPTATQATPAISVSADGQITATSTQNAGYVEAGTKSANRWLTTQAAQTITPGTSDKTIASGRYLTGTQTIKGDKNLIADNIKFGISIFGVTGKLGGLPANITALASGTVTIAQDSTYEMITHNLGVAPNFIAWIMEDSATATDLTSAALCGASFDVGSASSNIRYMVDGYNSSGSGGGTTARATNSTYMTTTQARMVAHNTYKLIGGKTYRWVCGVLDEAQ